MPGDAVSEGRSGRDVDQPDTAVGAGDERCRMARTGHRAHPGHRVVHRIEAGGTHRRFPAEPGDQIVQPVEKLVGRQVQVGQGPDGGPEFAHDGRRADPLAGDVARDQGDSGAGERDDVEPGAAGAGQQVAVRGLDGGVGGDLRRPEAELEDPGRRQVPAVEPGVVQAQRGARRQLHREGQVVLLVTVLELPPVEAGQAEDQAAGAHGDEHHGVHPGPPEQPGADRVQVEPRTVHVQTADQPGPQVSHALAVGRPRREPADLARERYPRCPFLAQRGRAGPAQWQALDVGSRLGRLSAQHRVEQVHRHRVREAGDGRVRQLLRRLEEVQGRTDAGPHPPEQREPALGPVPVGDVEDRRGDSQGAPLGVGQPEPGDRHRDLGVRLAQRADRQQHVAFGDTGRQHLAHHRHQGVRLGRLEGPQDLHERGTEEVAGRECLTEERRGVDPDDAQLRVHHVQADRGLGEERREDRSVQIAAGVARRTLRSAHSDPSRARRTFPAPSASEPSQIIAFQTCADLR